MFSALLAVSAHAFTSEPLVVTLGGDPATSFWRTAPSGDFTVYWEKPAGATSATLSVTGMDYSHEVANLAGTSCEIDFLPDGENVYNFTLTFDTGETMSASIARIATRGVDSVANVTIRLEDLESGNWRRTASRTNVLPIPAGTESFTVDGTEYVWDGAAGWYGLGPMVAKTMHEISLGGNTYWVYYRPKGGLIMMVQ